MYAYWSGASTRNKSCVYEYKKCVTFSCIGTFFSANWTNPLRIWFNRLRMLMLCTQKQHISQDVMPRLWDSQCTYSPRSNAFTRDTRYRVRETTRERDSFFTIWYTSLMLQLWQRSECGGNSSHRETHRLSKLWLGTGSSGPCASVSGMLRGRKGGQYRCAVSWTTERKRRAHSRSRFCDWTSARSMGPTHFCNVIKRTV